MPKVLSVLILVLMISLLIPTTLVLASQNAVPGDSTYPLKRTLEKAILALASLHPNTKAFFHVDLMNRRFKEAQILLAKGEKVSEALSELVVQTNTTANSVIEISNQSEKAKLIDELSKNIDEFDKQLVKDSLPEPTSPIGAQPIITPSPQTIFCTQDAKQCPDGSSVERVAPTCEFAPCPSSTAKPTVAPSPVTIVTPPPTPTQTESLTPEQKEPTEHKRKQREVTETRRQLEEIKKRLEEEKKKVDRGEKRTNLESEGKKGRGKRDKDERD